MSRSHGPTPSGRKRRSLVLGAAVVLTTGLAACGSSSHSSSSSSASASASSGNAASSGGSSDVATAAKAVAPFLKAPTSIGTNVPLKRRPPTGEKIDVLACQLQVCQAFRQQVASAAGTLGWKTTQMSFTGTPESTLQTVQSAISTKPAAIIINGVPRSTYQTALPMATADHVAIVTQMGELTGAATKPFVAVQFKAKQFGTMARGTANYVISSSGGKADALVVKYANFPLSIFISDTTAKTIASSCSGCKTHELTVQATDTGEQLANTVVSKLQQDPSINYVVFQDGAMALGIDAALASAGLTGKVKVVSNDVTPQVVASIESGKETAVMAFSLEAAAYAGVDAVARNLEGMSIPTLPLANQLFTKANLHGSSQPSLWNALPPNIAQQYAKLWHTS